MIRCFFVSFTKIGNFFGHSINDLLYQLLHLFTAFKVRICKGFLQFLSGFVYDIIVTPYPDQVSSAGIIFSRPVLSQVLSEHILQPLTAVCQKHKIGIM